MQLIDSSSATDVYSGEQVDFEEIVDGTMDVLVITTSCRPFSKTRSGRADGTEDHEDHRLLDIGLSMVEMTKPRLVIFEQVHGFALAESKTDKVSPLEHFLAQVKEELPEYLHQVFFCNGNAFLCLERHRVYLIFMHSDFAGAGGDAMELVKTVITANVLI